MPPPSRTQGISTSQRELGSASHSEAPDEGRRLEPLIGDRASARERALLVSWDIFVAVAAFAVSGAFGHGTKAVVATALMGLLAPAVLSAGGAYRRTSWLRIHRVHVLRRIWIAATIMAWSAVLLTLALGLTQHLKATTVAWAVTTLGWYVGRRFAALLRIARPERILIVGTGVVARRVTALTRRRGSAAVVVGCLDDGVVGVRPHDPPVLGGIDDLPELLAQGGIDRVVVAFSQRRDHRTLDVLRNASSYRGAIDVVPRLFDFVGPSTSTYHADGLAFLSIPGQHMSRTRLAVKRMIDIVVSSTLIILLSPLLLLIAAAILIESGRPILFRQRRVGMHGTSFSIIKFRTLRPTAGEEQANIELGLPLPPIGVHVEQTKSEAVRRATRFGRILRRSSLDELPQLFNVLAGHMSLVGPRPLSSIEDAMLTGWQWRRRDMRPGITGLWQVSGRSELSWDERASLDYAQVRHWSLTSDFQILADTLRAVLDRRGAS
jgi:exopolysaccharide biosynthesis polyprenyl glycosylphosphotransferase